MDWISKLPAWLAALALLVIACAFVFVVVKKPDRFEFAGLNFGQEKEVKMDLENAVLAFDSVNGEACPSGWSIFDPAIGRMILGAGSTVNGLPPNNQRAFRPAWSDNPETAVGGEERVALATSEIPEHRHNTVTRGGYTRGQGDQGDAVYWVSDDERGATLGVLAMKEAAKGAAHNNMPPYIALYFCKKD